MPYIQPELIAKAKEMDLLTYLKNYEPGNLVKLSNGVYCTREHDSLKISNGLWMWWSRQEGGKNAVDYLMKVKGKSFIEAVEIIIENAEIKESVYQKKASYDSPKRLILPEISNSNNKIIDYLVNQRCIDVDILSYCIGKGFIKESLPYHNVVFIGYDDKNNPRYACFRTTNDSRIMGDCTGSTKLYSFRLVDNNENRSIHLFESAIDLLSYATIIKDKGGNWKKYNLVSLAGVYQPKQEIKDSKLPIALEKYLEDNPQTEKIILHFDNDKAGRLASKALQNILPKNIKVIDSPPTYGKDVNDFLILNHNKKLDLERNYER